MDIEVKRSLDKFMNHQFVECISCALNVRDPLTGEHSRRVTQLSCLLCGVLQLTQEMAMQINLAANLHDIGKIGISDAVLLKPDKLSDDEWYQMKKHPCIGAEILSKSEFYEGIRQIILHHHERYDGKGYPDGAKGDEIPLGSRIIAICDSIDAMASDRAYRKAMSLDACKEEIKKNIGLMYDPVIAETMLNNWYIAESIYSA